MNVVPEDHLRCKRSNGTVWRCKELIAGNDIYCEKHRNYFKNSWLMTRGLNKESKKLKSSQLVGIDGLGTSGTHREEYHSDVAASVKAGLVESSLSVPALNSTLANVEEVSERIIQKDGESIPALPSLIMSVKSRKRTPKKAWDDDVIESGLKYRSHGPMDEGCMGPCNSDYKHAELFKASSIIDESHISDSTSIAPIGSECVARTGLAACSFQIQKQLEVFASSGMCSESTPRIIVSGNATHSMVENGMVELDASRTEDPFVKASSEKFGVDGLIKGSTDMAEAQFLVAMATALENGEPIESFMERYKQAAEAPPKNKAGITSDATGRKGKMKKAWFNEEISTCGALRVGSSPEAEVSRSFQKITAYFAKSRATKAISSGDGIKALESGKVIKTKAENVEGEFVSTTPSNSFFPDWADDVTIRWTKSMGNARPCGIGTDMERTILDVSNRQAAMDPSCRPGVTNDEESNDQVEEMSIKKKGASMEVSSEFTSSDSSFRPNSQSRKRKPTKAWVNGIEGVEYGLIDGACGHTHDVTTNEGDEPLVMTNLDDELLLTLLAKSKTQDSLKKRKVMRCETLSGSKVAAPNGKLVEEAKCSLYSDAEHVESQPMLEDNTMKCGETKEEVFTVEVVPLSTTGTVKEREKNSTKCHQCQRDEEGGMSQCHTCGTRHYCLPCIAKRYPGMTKDDFEVACPVCRKNCNCDTCIQADMPKNLTSLEEDKGQVSDVEKVFALRYMLSFLSPLVKQLHKEQHDEVELETSLKGDCLHDIRSIKLKSDERLYCDNCKTSIVDLYRSCPDCNYDLCVACCRELRQGQQPGGEEDQELSTIKRSGLGPNDSHRMLPAWRVYHECAIPCPCEERGGCGSAQLGLKHIGALDISRLAADVEAIDNHLPCRSAVSGPCSLCLASQKTGGPAIKNRRRAARREKSHDNYIFCPTVLDMPEDALHHFQRHWLRGEPVIVRDAFHGTKGLSWEPMALWKAVRETKGKISGNTKTVKALDYFNWCEVETTISQFLKGYEEGCARSDGWPRVFKLKDWPPAHFFRERHSAGHGTDFVSALPFAHYTHPSEGLLNLASKVPKGVAKPNLGPKADIGYGFKQEFGRGDSVTKLHCNLSDMANALTHSKEVKLSDFQLKKIKKYKHCTMRSHVIEAVDLSVSQTASTCKPTSPNDMVEKNMKDLDSGNYSRAGQASVVVVTATSEELPTLTRKDSRLCSPDSSIQARSGADPFLGTFLSRATKTEKQRKLFLNGLQAKTTRKSVRLGGALWDIFRREDVLALERYLRHHWTEFRHIRGKHLENVAHPIHDQTIYLNEEHKKQLKEEYGVEPWTFQQHMGEVVFIPAGCPHQVRNLQSCMKVALQFVSPESAHESLRLTEEYRALPENHPAKEDKLEIKKMVLYAASSAIKDLALTCDPIING